MLNTTSHTLKGLIMAALTAERPNKDTQTGVRRRRLSVGHAAGLALLLFGAFWMLLPLVWMLSASMMPLAEVIKVPPVWFAPEKYSFSNYVDIWTEGGFSLFFFNSLFVAIIVTGAQLLTSSMAGFAFARYDFPGRTLIFWIILSTLMIPFQVIMIPLFIVMARMGLVNTYWGIIIPSVVTPFGIFLMRQFMLGVPKALLEAARIDGASEPYIFARIMLPLCKPALATLAIFAFLGSWDNYLWPLIVINSQKLWTLPIGMSRFAEQYMTQSHWQMAGASIMFLPVLIVFLLMQRSFIEGVALSGLKG